MIRPIDQMVSFLEMQVNDPWQSIPGEAVASAALKEARRLASHPDLVTEFMPKDSLAPHEGCEGWGGTQIENCLLPPKPPKTYEEAINLYQNNSFFNRLVDTRTQYILSCHSTPPTKDGELVKKVCPYSDDGKCYAKDKEK